MRDPVQKFPVQTVEIVCVVEDPAKSSYLIAGVRQQAGDRCRSLLGEAQDLERRGKARIVPDSEKTEML